MKKQLSLTALSLIVLFSNSIYSQWSTDPTVNNPICTQANSQTQPVITNGSDGSFIITWTDNRNGNLDIYAQRINSTGDSQWAADGIAINSFTTDQDGPTIISDGSGGAIIAWRDERNGSFNRDIYIQRVNSSGVAQWNSDGVAVCTQGSNQFDTKIASDGSGGAIITWYDDRNGNYDIYAQRINSSGIAQWTADGVAVCIQTSPQWSPTITSDGSSGAIITWRDDRSGNSDIYAQRINSSGAALWTANGVAVCTEGSSQDKPTITSDGSGEAIITWEDYRNGGIRDIYAQRINSSGVAQWTANGVAVITNASHQLNPTIISDGSSGAILTWSDYRNANADIYVQRINSSGTALWTADGVAVCTNAANQGQPTLVGDGSSGAIITWYDDRNGNFDIYAAKISPDGALPVELVSFTGQLNENSVNFFWQTATEVNNYGFEVQRQNSEPVPSGDEGWEAIGFVLGHGTTNSPKDYSFIDSDLPNVNEVNYRLKQIDNDGTFAYSKIVTVDLTTITDVNDNGIVHEFALEQNYPNPFNPATTIRFSVASASRVNITVSNVLGQQVMELVNDLRSAGNHEITFNANNLATGVYIYKINAISIDGKTNFTNTRKMILMK
ncbi:hypothetical protein ASZ90_003929 [hydrocarbon metagenome]|uniref:Secretion system C-terminal sorting domain-containing protein n=1 Tax=hydrocarbon metagenome TaxID=938273 RepID=A0A0W8FZ99_9ZZZZ